jgi:heat-inducible transcriptional repressor
VLGVVGPTRLAYPRTISAVRYIAAVMSDMLSDLYGTDGTVRVAGTEDMTDQRGTA